MHVGEDAPDANAGSATARASGRAATSPTVNCPSAQAGHLLQAEHVRVVGGRELDHLVQVRLRGPGGLVLP